MSIRIEALRLRMGAIQLEVSAHLHSAITGIFGASGAGKTALLESIAGLRRPQHGSIVLDDHVVFDRRRGLDVASRLRRVGYVPQDHALFPHLSVRANLEYGMRHGSETAAVTVAHVAEVLEIAALLDRVPAALSGGERQRLALGRALLAAPRLVLLDEPLASLDRDRRTRALDLVRRVQREFAVPMLYVTHDADEVMSLCDDMLLLAAGRVVAHGTPETLLETSNEPQWRLRPEYRDRSTAAETSSRH